MLSLLSAEEETFRHEVVDFLTDFGTVDGFFHREGDRDRALRRLYRALGDRGWLALSWPKECGGRALPPVYEYILWNEMAYARAARPPLAAGIVAKTIIRHGTPEQRERFLPGIRAGTLFFSLAYSEPEAGSDLGSVRTRASRDGHDYVLDGEKRWTSGAHRADFLWTLCRTGTLESRSRGLSLFIVERGSPGVSIAPISAIDGERFNEVRFDSCLVPASNRIGEEGAAWPIIVESLATERHVQWCPKRVVRDYEDLLACIRSGGLDKDPVTRRLLADLAVSVAEAEALGLELLAAVQAGRPGVLEAACNKLRGSEVCQAIPRAALDLMGISTLERGSPFEFLWRQSFSETIGGGTSEILRSLIARLRFGLGTSR